MPLLAFVFLVALGVDYNIFLVTRAAEEARGHGAKQGMLRALAATGGVITSAGILLAAVFAVLGVLPLVVLAQLGVVICVGVLLDTLVVRTVLVPALALILGDRFWWPRRVGDRDAAAGGTGRTRRPTTARWRSASGDRGARGRRRGGARRRRGVRRCCRCAGPASDPGWYASLPRPRWQPPDLVFGVVWPLNFGALAVVGRRRRAARRPPRDVGALAGAARRVGGPGARLGARASTSRTASAGPRCCSPAAAVLTWLLVVATDRALVPWAGWVLVPYAAWLTVATASRWATGGSPPGLVVTAS